VLVEVCPIIGCPRLSVCVEAFFSVLARELPVILTAQQHPLGVSWHIEGLGEEGLSLPLERGVLEWRLGGSHLGNTTRG
jgi:hypothetical protein